MSRVDAAAYEIRERTQCSHERPQCSHERPHCSHEHPKCTHAPKKPAPKRATEKLPVSGSPPSPGDQIREKIEAMDQLLLSWEQYGYEFCDYQVQNFAVYAHGLQDTLIKAPMAKAEAIVKYLESTSIGHEIADLELVEKVSWGVNYLEKSLEESRLSQAIQTALASAGARLLNFEELPEPWQENPYIRKGYRFTSQKRGCLRSIFSLHNETANIWTHLLGVLLFLYLSLVHLPSTSSWQHGTWMDRLPMVVFMVAALKCLTCSVLWHSFCSISRLKTKRRMACMDYTGISVCICASILTTEYSVLNCHPTAQAFYMGITLACGVFGILINWHPVFDTTGARSLRALFFCSFAVFGCFAGLHAVVYRGAAETLVFYLPVLKSLLCYGTGVLFYATLFPERFFGGFDYCGSSHQVWHGFVVAGVYYHYKAMIEIFGRAVSEVCTISS